MKTVLDLASNVVEQRKPRSLGSSEAVHRKRFDDLTELACVVCQTSMAVISLTEKGDEHIRSQAGPATRLLPQELAFCRRVADGHGLLVVEDLAGEARFAGQRLAPPELGARFLAGVPLRLADDELVGTLCVLDRQPRRLDPDQQSALRALGRQAVTQIELRRALGRVARANAQQKHAEHALAEERNLLRTVIDSIPDSVYLKDADGRYLLDNQAHQQAVGAANAVAVIGKTVFDFFPASVAAKFDSDDQDVLRLGQPLINLEEPSVDRHGLARVLLTTKVPLRDSAGQLRGLVCVSRDITGRKQAEEALAKLAAIVDCSYDAIISKRLDGTILSWNAAAERMYGYPAHEVVGRHIGLLMPPDRTGEAELLRQGVQGERVVALETVHRHKDGRLFDVSVTVSPVRNEAGELIGASFIARDITCAKEAAQELRESEERFRLLVDGVSDYAVYMVHPRGHVMSWNAGAERIFGYSTQEILGEPVARFFKPSEMEAAAGELTLATGSGRCEREGWRVRKDGTWFYANVVTTALCDEGGAWRGFAQVVRDITELKQKTEDLEDSNRLLEQTLNELHRTQQELIQHERLRALGQMASGIAHDFNNALAPILGFSELLLSRPASLADQTCVARYLELIRLKARDAARIVGRLREFYRYRDDHDDFQPVQLNDLVRHALLVTRPKWEDEARAVGVAIEIVTDLQSLPSVTGLVHELQDAVTNLILNSVEALLAARQSGRIELGSRPDGGQVRLEIRDSGPGMDDQTRQRCFEPFFSTKTAHGTGLGLAMVYGIVTRHGGLISIASEPGQGTTVMVRLPVETSRQINGFQIEAGNPAQPLRILLVDDEPELREVAAEFLKEDGHVIELAVDGRQALAKFQAGDFDLVLTDKAMPELNGEQLAVAIKELRPETPVVLITGFGEMMKAAGEKPVGIDLILSKPLSMLELRQAVARYAPLNQLDRG